MEVEAQHVEPLSSGTVRLRVKDFIWSEDEWPTAPHDAFAASGEDTVPTVSLSRAESVDYGEECRRMVEACGTWGFFVLVDHGVDAGVVDAMKGRCAGLFVLPMEQKLRGGRDRNGLPLGYSATNADYVHNLPWVESVQLLQSPRMVVDFARKVYGNHLHQPLSDTMVKYMDALDQLGMSLLEMLAHGLGLPRDFFAKNFGEKESTMVRVNHYPPCPLPERCLGLGSHTDPHALTILMQDEVGGLQVQKADGNWVGIRPVPNSFVINVGDILEAWTNARLRSVVHRAVVNRERSRLSVAYFMLPAGDVIVDCPTKLLDDDDEEEEELGDGGGDRRRRRRRKLYSAFTWNHFRKELITQKRVVAKNALNRYRIADQSSNPY